MSNRRFEMYEYRAVLVRMRQGDSDRAIARSGLMGRSKVRRFRALADLHGWLESGNPLPGEEEIVRVAPIRSCPQSTGSSSVEPYRAQVESWVREGIQVTTIQRALERIHGYRGSYSSVNRFVRDLCIDRPRATVHLTFEPGEAGQVDFGAGPRMVDVRSGEELKTWFFLMTLAFSRHQYAELVLDQRTETWLECHRRAFEWFGGAPARIIIDNARCAITRACFHDPVAQRAYAEYAEGYRFRIDACPPRDPKKKGRVEAGIKYLKRGFVPTREFRSLADANEQLREWVLGEAGNRIHGSTGEQPLGLFALERPALGPLPDQPPETAVWARVKVHQDAHVHYGKCLYSVPYRFAGESLWLKAAPQTIRIYREHELVATHVRAFSPRARHTNPDHLPPNALAYQRRTPTWRRAQAREIGSACHTLVQSLFDDDVMYNIRKVQGILGLVGKYGPQRLEAACRRALHYHDPQYRTIKSILEKGLDAEPCDESDFDTLADCYTGKGRFCRDTRKLIGH